LPGIFFDRKTGLLAGLLAAVYAPFLFFEGNLLGTAIESFLLTASVFCLIETRKDRTAPWFAFLSGVALALATTGRPNLLLLLPLPILFFFIQQKNRRKQWSLSLLVMAGLLLPLLLTGIHNHLAGGQFTLLTSHGGINFYIGNHENATGVWLAPDGIDADVRAINLEQSKAVAEKMTGRTLTPLEVSRFWTHRALAFIGQHPPKWAGLMATKFYYFWLAWEAPLNYNYYFHQQYSTLLRFPVFNLILYLPLAILGVIFFAPDWKKYWLLYAVIFIICLSVVLFFVADRYRLSALPFLMILAAAAVTKLMHQFREKHPHRWFGIAGLILLIGVQFGLVQSKIAKTNFANDYYNLALANLIGNNPRGSITWGERAAAANPTDAKVRYNLGVAWLKLGDDLQAMRAFRQVLEIDPTDAGAHRNLGALLLQQNDYPAALRALQQSLKLEPGNVTSLMNLGLAYYYLADLPAAIAAWTELLKIEPGNEQAQKNILAARFEQPQVENNSGR
jgi:tetratricopeptide (TPR) repeat protein